jgi:hypothetical protein
MNADRNQIWNKIINGRLTYSIIDIHNANQSIIEFPNGQNIYFDSSWTGSSNNV